jgi:hypothetical protein
MSCKLLCICSVILCQTEICSRRTSPRVDEWYRCDGWHGTTVHHQTRVALSKVQRAGDASRDNITAYCHTLAEFIVYNLRTPLRTLHPPCVTRVMLQFRIREVSRNLIAVVALLLRGGAMLHESVWR